MRDAVDHTRVAFCRDGAGEKSSSVVRQEMEETLRNFHVDLEIKIRSTALQRHDNNKKIFNLLLYLILTDFNESR